MNEIDFFIENENDTVNFGAKLAKLIKTPFTLYLTGELGAGKTTMSRGIIQNMGHDGAVKSPTYALVEPYNLNDLEIYHFDLYRLSDPDELEFMGIRDYFNDKSICIVEWPDNGAGFIPSADVKINLSYQGLSRVCNIQAISVKGCELLAKLK